MALQCLLFCPDKTNLKCLSALFFLWGPVFCLYIWTTDEAGVSLETERLMQIIYHALLPALLLSVSLMELLHLAPLALAVMFLGVSGGFGTRFLFFDLEGSPERMH